MDRSLCAEPDRRDSITVIGWMEEAVLAQTPGGLDGNTGRGHDAPGREGKEAEDGIGVVQVWKQGRLNRGRGVSRGLGRRRREGRGVQPARNACIQGIGVFPEAATDDDGSRRQFGPRRYRMGGSGYEGGGIRRRSRRGDDSKWCRRR